MVGRNPSPPEGLTLAAAARSHGITFGTAVNSDRLERDGDYRRILGEQFAMVTPETAMKFATLAPARGRYDFTSADAFMAAAEVNGQEVRGHTLVWHRSLPEWVANTEPNAEQARALLREYITTVMSHYRGRIAQWDVENEPLNDDGELRDSFWLRTIGPEYVADAFRYARAADPEAKLFLNETGAETSGRKARGLTRLIDDLRAQSAPIDGVGYETHVSDTFDDRDADVMRTSMLDMASRGLAVAITELDVRVERQADGTFPDERQRAVYGRIVGLCRDQPACRTIVVWGVDDGSSWIPSKYPDAGAALLYNDCYQPKPVRSTVLEALAN